jgi:Ribbon-helix-helix protein, copG family
MCCMSATRTQVYLTEAQRAGLDQRAEAERTTMAQVIRAAIDRYLAEDLGDAEREQVLVETFGSRPNFGAGVPSRDEWDRR